MAKLRVNKIEAARRQIDAAIRMLFSNEDPVAIYTLSMAAFRILRDLASKRSDSYMEKIAQAIIKPGKEKECWSLFLGPANFLKHADRDPDAILDNVDEVANDFILFWACTYYQDLGNQFTPEMNTLVSWFMALYPDLVRDDAMKATLAECSSLLQGKSRQEQLKTGQQLLQLAMRQPRRY